MINPWRYAGNILIACLIALAIGAAFAPNVKPANEQRKVEQELKVYQDLDSINRSTIRGIQEENSRLHHISDSLILISQAKKVTCTQYYPTGDKTASDMVIPNGYKAKEAKYKIIAVSHDLLIKNGGFLKFGDKVRVYGTPNLDGIYHVEDTTHKRFKNRIDILVSHNSMNEMYKNVKIIKV